MAKRWYVVHAYSGFENQVARALNERIARESMQEKFGDILVPTEEVIEMRGGQKRRSDWFHPFTGIYAQKILRDVSRIGLRPEQIENGPYRHFHTCWADMTHGRVMVGREHKADIGFLDAFGNRFRREIEFYAQGRQRIVCA